VEDVQAPETRSGGGNGRDHLGLFGQVALEGNGAATRLGYLHRHPLGRLAIDVSHYNRSSLPGQSSRRRSTDASAAAGHDGDPVDQSFHEFPLWPGS
jgi:hypothetical protein